MSVIYQSLLPEDEEARFELRMRTWSDPASSTFELLAACLAQLAASPARVRTAHLPSPEGYVTDNAAR